MPGGLLRREPAWTRVDAVAAPTYPAASGPTATSASMPIAASGGADLAVIAGGAARRARPSRRAPRRCRRPPATAREVLERRAHRDRVRVVGVVDERHAVRRARSPPRASGLNSTSRRPSPSGMPRTSQTVSAASVLSSWWGARKLVSSLTVAPADREAARLLDARRTGGSRCRRASGRARAAARPGTTATPPGGSASISSAFALATFSTVPTSSRWTGRDVRDQPDLRPGERGEPGDLAEPAHPHLDDAELGVGLDPAERQRHAELVVEVPLGGDRAEMRAAERGEDVLRGRLPGRAGDADDARARAVAHGAADRGERPVRARRGRARPRRRARERARRSRRRRRRPRTGRPPRSGASRSACPVTSVAQGRAVEPAERLEELELERDHGRAAHRPGAQASRAHVRPSGRRRAPSRSRAPARARRRGRRSRRRRPACAAARASSIAARRSSSTSIAPSAPGGDLGGDRLRRLGAGVVGGEDRAVGELGDDPPHQRPLAAVAVAAGAEDDDAAAPAPSPRAARMTRSRASRGCGRSRRSR